MSYDLNEIRCPQCGDRSKSAKGDHCRCGNCKTEYYIDAVGVTTNVADVRKTSPSLSPPAMPLPRQTPPPPPQSQGRYSSTQRKKSNGNGLYWIIPIFMLIFGGLGYGGYKFFKYIEKQPTFGASLNGTEHSVYYELNFPVVIDNQLYVAAIGKREYRTTSISGRSKDDARDGYYFTLVDVVNDEEITCEKLDDMGRIDRARHRHFSNGKDYIILDGSKVYELGKAEKTLLDVTDQLLGDKTNPDLAIGIAKVEFAYESNFEGFKLVNNQGKEFSYNPWVKGKYPKNSDDYANVFGVSRDTTYYAFSSKSSTCRIDMPKNEEIQLLKIVSKYVGCEPQKPQWNTSYDFKKEKTLFRKKELIKSFKNLTPDTFYFKPSVVYSDNDGRLLIKGYETPSDNSAQYIKCLDANTGKEKWSITLDNTERNKYFFKPEDTVFAAGYYLIKSELSAYTLISEDGLSMEEYELESR